MYILKFVKKNRGYEKITFKEFEFPISCIGRASLALTTRYDTLSALRLHCTHAPAVSGAYIIHVYTRTQTADTVRKRCVAYIINHPVACDCGKVKAQERRL